MSYEHHKNWDNWVSVFESYFLDMSNVAIFWAIEWMKFWHTFVLIFSISHIEKIEKSYIKRVLFQVLQISDAKGVRILRSFFWEQCSLKHDASFWNLIWPQISSLL